VNALYLTLWKYGSIRSDFFGEELTGGARMWELRLGRRRKAL
jgi:hypothetical protein